MAAPRSKLAFRSRDRKMVKSLEKAITHIKSMDTRRTDAASKIGSTPVLFSDPDDATLAAAIDKLTLRCIDSLSMRISDGQIIP